MAEDVIKGGLGAVRVNFAEARRRVKTCIRALREASPMVVSDPDIRGGEPVVSGTRVPVYLLADLTMQGASAEELFEDYPSITENRLQAALVYAAANPRPGRPKYGDVTD